MKKILFTLLTLVCIALLIFCSCTSGDTSGNNTIDGNNTSDAPDTDGGNEGDDVEDEDIVINSISEYNKTSEKDSHAGSYSSSQLEQDFRESYLIDTSALGVSTLYYPRIKQAADGSYLLFYQNGKTGTSIRVARSTNLKAWFGVTVLFAKSGSKFYATSDAIVLDNGDILAVASFNGSYKGDAKNNGISMRRSTDNGKTWSEEQVIYVGTTWEPSLLQLDSGEIQMYWTNTHVGGVAASLGGRADDNSTGTMMIRSFDNGVTWTGDLSVAYGGQIVAQQLTKKGSDGNYYSGQMPVAVQLNNGDIALALEIRLPKTSSQGDTFHLSFAYSPGVNSWPVALGDDEEGPSSLVKSKFTSMAGPYLKQFDSGETVLTYHWGGKWYYKLGNNTATAFTSSVEYFEGKAIDQWGATEITGAHSIIGTVPAEGNAGAYIAMSHLNHTINAENTDITLDGSCAEWNNIDQAFFVGSKSQAQASIRTAQDEENIYFYAEVLDRYLSDKDSISFYLCKDTIGDYINVSVSAIGDILVKNKMNKTISDSGVEAIVKVAGTIGNFDDIDKGYVIELKVPKATIGTLSSSIYFNPTLFNKDSKSSKPESDTVGDISITNVSKWLLIKIG